MWIDRGNLKTPKDAEVNKVLANCCDNEIDYCANDTTTAQGFFNAIPIPGIFSENIAQCPERNIKFTQKQPLFNIICHSGHTRHGKTWTHGVIVAGNLNAPSNNG